MSKTNIIPSRIADGVTLYYIEDSKYKTNYTNVYFTLPLTSENATKASLAAKLLKRGSKRYPSMAELNSALDMNYASTLSFSSFKEGEKTVFAMSLATMKNSFAPNGEDIYAEAIGIAFDALLCPLTENGGFKEEYFESEKKNLKDSILSQINNKASYSRTRFISEMCEGEAYGTNGEGDLSALEGITSADLYDFLKNMIETAVCDIYFVGTESEERVKELNKKAFSGIKRACGERIKTSLVTDIKGKNVTETLDIAQAHLWIGFRTPATYSSPDYLKFVLFNMVMGGDVSSKMFMNIREKLSLCYTCYSALDGMKGIFMAYAGIDPENKEKTLNAFFEELENVRAGKVSETELEDAKKAYINRMKEIQDNPSLLPAWFHMRLESDIPRDPSSDAEEIARLTLEDVIWAAGQIEKDTVYFLTKTETESYSEVME
ncbi:MAG: insulinase family protein [Ruminococcaceae bacterium]|nr:insulinase family protein [Oscillospiraceae bacterium]